MAPKKSLTFLVQFGAVKGDDSARPGKLESGTRAVQQRAQSPVPGASNWGWRKTRLPLGLRMKQAGDRLLAGS